MKKIYLTEEQFNSILSEQMLYEGVFKNLYDKLFAGCSNKDEVFRRAIRLVAAGILSIGIVIDMIAFSCHTLTDDEKNDIVIELAENSNDKDWKEVCNDAIITVYNAEAGQCNKDFQHTASMFKLNLNDVGSHKIVAMERTFMKSLGLKYGDVIKIEGTYKGLQDGVYQIQDTMNKRFAGQHKIDILVPSNIRYGGTLPNEFAKVYILKDEGNSQKYLDLMAPQAKE